MKENRGQYLSGLRGSNAAGPHDHEPTRTEREQEALKDQEPFTQSSYYTYAKEADGYVTVLDEGGNPIEYEILYIDAYARYGDESWPLPG